MKLVIFIFLLSSPMVFPYTQVVDRVFPGLSLGLPPSDEVIPDRLNGLAIVPSCFGTNNRLHGNRLSRRDGATIEVSFRNRSDDNREVFGVEFPSTLPTESGHVTSMRGRQAHKIAEGVTFNEAGFSGIFSEVVRLTGESYQNSCNLFCSNTNICNLSHQSLQENPHFTNRPFFLTATNQGSLNETVLSEIGAYGIDLDHLKTRFLPRLNQRLVNHFMEFGDQGTKCDPNSFASDLFYDAVFLCQNVDNSTGDRGRCIVDVADYLSQVVQQTGLSFNIRNILELENGFIHWADIHKSGTDKQDLFYGIIGSISEDDDNLGGECRAWIPQGEGIQEVSNFTCTQGFVYFTDNHLREYSKNQIDVVLTQNFPEGHNVRDCRPDLVSADGCRGQFNLSTVETLKEAPFQLEINDSLAILHVAFPGAESFCGSYNSPLMIFFDHRHPKYEETSDFLSSGDGKTTWPEANHPGYFLVRLNAEERSPGVTRPDQLFGGNSLNFSGFEELEKLDENKDGVLNKSDSLFSELLLAKYLGRDETSGEKKWQVKTLEEMGITEINLKYDQSYRYEVPGRAVHHGLIRLSYKDPQSGEIKFATMTDVFFREVP